jgi:hypothetical protein
VRRLVWAGLGAAAGIWALQRARRTATALTPPALLAGLRDAASTFTGEVRAGMAEREAELRGALGIDAAGTPAPGSTAPGNAAPRPREGQG